MPYRILPRARIGMRRWYGPVGIATLAGMDYTATRSGSNNPKKLFVIEGAPEIRKRLVAMVSRVAGIEVVGEANTMLEASEAILGKDVQMLLLGLRLMAGGDLSVLARLKQQRPQLRTIVLSNSTGPQYLQAALAAGADFCLDKTCEFDRVPEILRDWLTPSGDRAAGETNPDSFSVGRRPQCTTRKQQP